MTKPVNDFIAVSPVLTVDNAVETLEFYRDKLGFEAVWTVGEPPYYAVVKQGSVSIHFSEREEASKKIRPCHIYVVVADVDSLYEELKAKGLRIFVPPENLDHGMREFEVADLNGHFLTFAQRL